MYFLGLVTFLIFLVFSTLFSSSLTAYIDLPSIILILAFCIPILMAAGLIKDFIRGFKIMSQRINTCSMLELKKTDIAMRLMIRLLLLSGLLGSMISIVSVLANLGNINKLGPILATAFLTPLYSVVIVFILLPVQAKVKAVLLTIDKE